MTSDDMKQTIFLTVTGLAWSCDSETSICQMLSTDRSMLFPVMNVGDRNN